MTASATRPRGVPAPPPLPTGTPDLAAQAPSGTRPLGVPTPPSDLPTSPTPVAEAQPAALPHNVPGSRTGDPRTSASYKPPRDGQHKLLRPDEIVANPANPRSDFSDLNDLESMATVGVLQALAVIPRDIYEELYTERKDEIEGDGAYVLLAGERRWTMAQRLLADVAAGTRELGPKVDLTKLPVIVHTEKTRRELDQFAFQENGGRTDLPPMDEARALADYQTRYGITSVNALAKELGLPQPRVYKRLALLALAPAAHPLIESGELGPETAFDLRAAGDHILEAWRLTRDQGMTAKSAVAAVTAGTTFPLSQGAQGLTEAEGDNGDPQGTELPPVTPARTTKGTNESASAQARPNGKSEQAEPAAQEPTHLTAQDREAYRRERAGLMVSKRYLSLKNTAEILARMILDGRQLDPESEALAMAGEWLGRDPLATSTPQHTIDAGLATVLAVAELRASQTDHTLDGQDGYYFDLLARGIGYAPSDDEAAAIQLAKEAKA